MCNAQKAASPQQASSTVTSIPAASGKSCFVFGEHLAERVVMPADTEVVNTTKTQIKEKIEGKKLFKFLYSRYEY
jgi:patatin-like phospholipase/acyl hydrolase